MTNHTFKVITQQARPYQGFPYVNPAYTEAPSVAAGAPPVTAQPVRAEEPGPLRPVFLELHEVQTQRAPEPISLAERELRERYGQSRETRDPRSPYVDETIFYDPFENRRIAHPKDQSPVTAAKPRLVIPPRDRLDGDSDDSESLPGSYASLGGPSASRAGPPTPHYTKQAALYGNSPESVLPEPMPMEQFPEPPPAYTVTDLTCPTSPAYPAADTSRPTETPVDTRPRTPAPPAPATLSPTNPVNNVITTPTPTVGQNPSELYNPSRKIVTCQFCRQTVLTIIKKENGTLTHTCACLMFICGLIPCTICVYCTDHFKESRHYCPYCDLLVGKDIHSGSGRVEYREEAIPNP